MKLLPLLLVSTSLGLFGCAAESSTAAASDEQQASSDAYAFVFLLAGPREGQLSAEELQAARNGHFGNIARLAEEGVLLLAGPLFDPRSDLAHRGIFLFDVDDLDDAWAIAETDPGVQLGAFALDVFPFRSSADFRSVWEIERAAKAAKALDPNAPQPKARAYMLATADAGTALPVIEHLEREGAAYFHGFFGGELKGTTIVALDATTKDIALTVLDDARQATGIDVEWTLHGWYSTESLTALTDG
jgi:uncharacterized protein YciI